MPPTLLLTRRFGASRTGCVGGPAHAREMVSVGAGLVAASTEEALASAVSGVFSLAGHIFAEVWRRAEAHGARPESMIGLAGTGDLVATALAPESRNRRAGELLAQGVPVDEILSRVGQAIEEFDSVPLLARAITEAGIEAPVTSALANLISGELPLEDWIAVVRTTLPPAARWRPSVRPGFWLRLRERIRRWSGPRGKPDTRVLLTMKAGMPLFCGNTNEGERTCRRSSLRQTNAPTAVTAP